MDAIGADYQIRSGDRTVVKFHFHLVGILDQINASVIEVNEVRRQCGGQQFEQLGTMKMIIRRPEDSLAFVSKRLTGEGAAVIPTANMHRPRPYAVSSHRTSQVQTLQNSAGIGTDLNAGANLAQCGRLLEDLGFDSSSPQG